MRIREADDVRTSIACKPALFHRPIEGHRTTSEFSPHRFTSLPFPLTLTAVAGGKRARAMSTSAVRPKAKSRRHTTTHDHRPAISVSSSRPSLVLALTLSCALLSSLPTTQASSLSSRSEDAWDAPQDSELRRERYPYRYGRQRERERWRRTDVPAAGYFDPDDSGGSMLTVRLSSVLSLGCASDEAFFLALTTVSDDHRNHRHLTDFPGCLTERARHLPRRSRRTY